MGLAIICLAIFVPICFLTPCYYADDGGYMQMLNYFVQTGKVDLMRWSQPTAVGLLLPGWLVACTAGSGFVQLDLIGVVFALAALAGLYTLFRALSLPATLSFLLVLSIFCFNEITFVTPTFMTDMPFLAYCIWWLVLTQRTLRRTEGVSALEALLWCTLLILALLTRSTGLMALPALMAAAVLCSNKRKQLLTLTGLFILSWVISAGVARMLTINPLSFLQTTALKEIFQLHDFARFNLRAGAIATLSVIFAASPVLVAVSGDRKWRLLQCLCAAVCAVAAIYFSYKGLFQPLEGWLRPVAVVFVALGAFHLPPVFAEALRNNRSLSIILLVFMALGLAVLPIMAHPLVRHVIPAMVSLIALTAIANKWRVKSAQIIFVLSSLLLITNVLKLQQIRMVDYAGLNIAQRLIERGFRPDQIDAGWAWFCHESLKPGVNEPQSYVERYGSWQRQAKFAVGSKLETSTEARELIRVPVTNFAFKDVVVLALKQFSN